MKIKFTAKAEDRLKEIYQLLQTGSLCCRCAKSEKRHSGKNKITERF